MENEGKGGEGWEEVGAGKGRRGRGGEEGREGREGLGERGREGRDERGKGKEEGVGAGEYSRVRNSRPPALN